MDYVMFCVDDILMIEIDCIIMLCLYNLLGVKGVGEVGVIGLIFVVVNVVMDVLFLFGVKNLFMFLILESVWRVMNSQVIREVV